jgi:hypothetical protein
MGRSLHRQDRHADAEQRNPLELAALLTIAYTATGFFMVPVELIAVIVVLNDVVTIALSGGADPFRTLAMGRPRNRQDRKRPHS